MKFFQEDPAVVFLYEKDIVPASRFLIDTYNLVEIDYTRDAWW